MRYTILLAVSLIFFGCDSEKETKNSKDWPEARVEITDTLEIEYQGNLKMVDYNRQNKLFMSIDQSRKNNVILIFDREGNIQSTFDNEVAGGNAVSGKINAAGFDKGNGGYIIISSGGVYYFNSNWERLKYIPNPERGKYTRYNPSGKLLKIKNKGTDFIITQLLATPTGYNIETKEHYELVKLLTIINTEDSTFNLDIGFHESSNYRTESRLYTPYLSFYDYLKNENQVITAYRNDKKLYYYSIGNDGELEYDKSYSFDFDHYSIKSNFNYGDVFHISKTLFDSRIESLESFENKIYVNYVKEMDNNEFENNPSLYNDRMYLQEYITKNFQHCMHIIEDGQKLYQDIVLPDMLVTPIVILEKNEILFHLSKSKYEFDNEVFLIGKVEEM